MKAVLIDPARKQIEMVEGEADEMVPRLVSCPASCVDLARGTAMVCNAVGAVGNDIDLWWHHAIGEVFGGKALVFGLDGQGKLVSVLEGEWLRSRRSVEFLGTGNAALPRLHKLVDAAIYDASSERQLDFGEMQ